MQITNGIQVQFIPTTKFKDIGISVRFRNTLQMVNQQSAHYWHSCW